MTHRCPACGAPIAPGSATCIVCRAEVIWPNESPSVASDASLIDYGWPAGLVVTLLVALALVIFQLIR